MFVSFRPDVTNEGWNTWPTEVVSHALARRGPLWAALQTDIEGAHESGPPEVAALRLASGIRSLIEDAVRDGDARDLRESLITYGLSRVDWLQLAQAQIEMPNSDQAVSCRVATPAMTV